MVESKQTYGSKSIFNTYSVTGNTNWPKIIYGSFEEKIRNFNQSVVF